MTPSDPVEQLVLPNVYGIVRREGADSPEILVQRRWKPASDPVNSGRWELPGGKWRAWERATDCLAREVWEESGVEIVAVESRAREVGSAGQTVEATRPFAVVQMTAGPYPSVLLVFEAVGRGEPADRGDGSRDAQWMPRDRLIDTVDDTPEDWTPLSLLAIRQWIEAGERGAERSPTPAGRAPSSSASSATGFR